MNEFKLIEDFFLANLIVDLEDISSEIVISKNAEVAVLSIDEPEEIQAIYEMLYVKNFHYEYRHLKSAVFLSKGLYYVFNRSPLDKYIILQIIKGPCTERFVNHIFNLGKTTQRWN